MEFFKGNIAAFARMALLMTSFVWGTAFIILKNSVEEMSSGFVLGVRFSIAAVITAVIFRKHFKNLNKAVFKRGIVNGILVFIGYMTCAEGIRFTTASKSSFLTAIYCVLTPFVCWLLIKKRPNIFNISAGFMCIAGIGFISLNEGFSISLGDSLSILSGVAYAFQISYLGLFCRDDDPMMQCFMQISVTAVLSWIYNIVVEGGVHPEHISADGWKSLIFLAVCSTVLAFVCQNWGQRIVPASSAALLMSLESVFGVTMAVIIGGESVSPRLAVGFAAVFAAIVISETELSFIPYFRHRRETENAELKIVQDKK